MSRTVIAVAIVLMATGCVQGKTSPPGPRNQAPTGPAAPAPIKIPQYQQLGLPLTDEIRAGIEDDLRAACGDGTLCVDIAFEVADPPPEFPSQEGECAIIKSPSGTVQRGGTVTYVVDAPCP
ncbi:hypothetical protein ABZ816_37865 [Actinosynnema sp. NPDC047251]|uniref:Putative secreted protein n=1 Tax=Saccharothrix espanaensis (strain ATCC 51144 / DSM 44229 / JCM 9112 / NBRC 15066 / NRRL 15764) TaxID=1179773 RepID=K0K0Y3_SACES|nr:hypothetical protein [Saccharothrix espanaensis]CCH30233.1 putative secreted protein [Saccharothrix espanaensis DSM 44229]